jgi:hypothetical protein
LIEVSQEINFFDLFKIIIRKTISIFLLFLKHSFEKIRFQNTILYLFESYTSIFQKVFLAAGPNRAESGPVGQPPRAAAPRAAGSRRRRPKQASNPARPVFPFLFLFFIP